MEDITIDLAPTPLRQDGIEYTDLPDGGLELNYAPDTSASPMDEVFDANLAEALPANLLNQIAEQVVEWVEADQEARVEWKTRFEDGLKIVGLVKEGADDGPFPGAATVVHPLIMEAAIQFQARAIKELFPPAGPVKGVVLGQKTEEKAAQGQRVEDFMNYQMTTEDRSYFWDVDKMLLWLPLVGSCFKKSYFDPSVGLRSKFILPQKVLVPYTATSLEDTPRITHVDEISQAEFRRRQRSGLYLDKELPEPQEPYKDSDDGLDKVDDRTPSLAEGDAQHTIYECHCEYEIPGISQDGEPLPFVITVERDSQATVGIYRNWKETDERARRRLWFTHYPFFTGLGFYGFGYIHVIGSLNEAATGAVRALLDSAAFATMQGGFKGKDVRLKGGEITLKPGVYQDCELTSEELTKAFYTPPFKEPSPALVQMLQMLVEAGQRFASTTDVLTGDASNMGPVGTTVALIEQSSLPFSAIHKRLHVAAGEEFRLRAELNSENLPPYYPYEVEGESRYIMQADFDDRVDIAPVSDPNIFSSTQRIAIAQGVLELANSAPQMYDTYEAHKRMLEAMRVPDIDNLLPNPNDIPHTDPVSEGSYLFVGKPVLAHVDEDHAAHLMIHQAQMQTVMASPLAQTVSAALMAHIAEHVALQYTIQMSQMLGLPLPQPDLRGKKREEMDPQIANEIAIRAAMAIQGMQAMQANQMQQQVDQQQAMDDQAHQAESARADEGMQADEERKNQAFQSQEARKDQAMQAQVTRDQVKAATEYLKSVNALDVDPVALVETSQKLGKSFDEALQILREAQMGGLGSGQGQGPAPIAQEVAQ
jgi:chaperonin GroES